MEWVPLLKWFTKVLVLPPAGPLLLALAGLALARRAPRAGGVLAWTGTLVLVFVSLPIGAWLLASPFDRAPFQAAQAADAQAIVILGGGTRRAAPEYGGDTLGRLTLERVRYGAIVAKTTGLPVLVSGGAQPDVKSSEAALMRDALAREFGVAVRWAEDRSLNTHENARYSAQLLKADGVTRVVLVAHAIDMPRAGAEFAAAGIETIAAATGLWSDGPLVRSDFLPTAAALQLSHDALYELIANLALRLIP